MRTVIHSHRRYQERTKARVKNEVSIKENRDNTGSEQSKTKENEQRMYNICDRQGQILPKLPSVQLHRLNPLNTMSLSI